MKNKSFNHFQKIASVFLIAILVFLPAACDGSTGYLPVDQNGPSITLTPAVTKQPEVPAAVPISLENATQMKELMHWGKGFPVLLHWVPDGSKFLLVTTVGIAIYDATTLTELALIPLTGGLSSLDVSRDGTMVAVGLDTEMVEIYQLSDYQPILSLQGPKYDIYSLSFSPDGKMLAAGGNPDAVIWSIPDGHKLFRLNQDGVITFSQDGKSLFIAEDNVRMRDIQSGKTLKTFSLTDPADVLALTMAASGKPTPDGILVPAAISALSTDGKNLTVSCYYEQHTGDAPKTIPSVSWIELWNEQDSTHRILPIGEERIKSYSLAPNGVEIAVSMSGGALTLWNIASGQQVKILSESSADSLAYSPDGQRLAAVLDDNTVRFWETETYSEVGQITGFSGSEINAIDFSPDGQTLAVGGSDGIVNVWRFPSGALLYNLVNAYVSTPFYSSDSVETLSFSPDGSTLVTGSYYSCILRLWSVADRRVLWQSKQFGGSLEEAKFSPDGAYIGVIDPHPNFRLVNAAQGKTIASLKEVTGYDFSTDSQTVVL